MEPVKMYRTAQIVKHNLPVDLPQCMYKMKNIHATSSAPSNGFHVTPSPQNLTILEKVKQFLKVNSDLPEMAALQERQEKILSQLNDLRKQIDSLKGELKSSNVQVKSSSICNKAKPQPKIDVSKLPDLIINANPTMPPYSLQVAQKLLSNSVHLSITSHLHSTVPTIPKEAQALATSLEQCKPKAGVPSVKIRLIWKKVDSQMELIINSMPIVGEANILRYLARVIPLLKYEQNDSHDIDVILDTSYLIAQTKTKSERVPLLQLVSKKMGKDQWLTGKEITIADLSAYSAIKQSAAKEINATLTKWLQRVEAL